MGIRIEKINLRNIGPFGQIELSFPKKTLADKAEIHILTGENGTGKSTVLEVMAAYLRKDTSTELLMKWRKTKDNKNEAQLFFDFGTNHVRMINTRVLEPRVKSDLENLFSKRHDNFTMSLFPDDYWTRFSESNAMFNIAFFAYSGYRRVSNIEYIDIQEPMGHPLDNALDFQKSIDPRQMLQWIAYTLAMEAIAKSQGNTEEAEAHRTALQRIEETIGSIIGKKVKFQIETKPYAVKIEVDGERLDFNLLPDGLKSIISWMADLLMRMDRVKWENDTPVFERNFILFLDEIEVHMHPAWQRKILPAVQKLFPNAQIFISTHSPFVVGSVDGAWIHKLVKPNGDSQLAEGFPMLSEDAKSYRYWLNEVFDITAEYGEDAEAQIKEFYELRDNVLKGADETVQNLFVKTGKMLADQSQELRNIIEMEIRQVNRRRSLQLSLYP